MTEDRWRTVAIVLGVVLVLLVVLVFVTSLPIGSPSPTPSATGRRPSGSAAGSPSESAATPTPGETESPSASATPPSPTPGVPASAGLATISFTGFKLDADDDSAGKARTFTFKTDGPGTVKAKLTGKSPQGTTKFCLKVGIEQGRSAASGRPAS